MVACIYFQLVRPVSQIETVIQQTIYVSFIVTLCSLGYLTTTARRNPASQMFFSK